MSQSTNTLQQPDAEALRHEIAEASEPISHFWPMSSFVHHNPIHGLENLPFDEAIRRARHLLEGHGYLPNEEYRQLHRSGRITGRSVDRALGRVGPRLGDPAVRAGAREVAPRDVLRAHLVFGVESLDPRMLSWALEGDGAIVRLRRDLPPEIRTRVLERAGRDPEPPGRSREESYSTGLWRSILSVLGLPDPTSEHRDPAEPPDPEAPVDASGAIDLPPERTLSDWVDQLSDGSVVDAIDDQMIKWIAAFVDEGMAGWGMPLRDAGFYQAWRELASRDASGRLLGIRGFRDKLLELPSGPEEAILHTLRRLSIPSERWRDYLSRLMAQLPGWAGFIRWRGENPDYPPQREHPIDTTHYLAVRLFYEAELTQVASRRHWNVDATLPALVSYWRDRPEEYRRRAGELPPPVDRDTERICRDAWRLFHLAQTLALTPEEAGALGREDAERLLRWLDALPSDRHGPIWLEAYEDSYREDLVSKLAAHRGKHPESTERPRAQAVFCIDVRSESFRRHLESRGPYQTYGFAGFFGVPISHRIFDTEESRALCPVLLKPTHAAFEVPRSDQGEPLQYYAAGSRWRELGDRLFHDLKHNPVAAFPLVDVVGLFFSLGLIGKTLLLRPYEAVKSLLRRRFVAGVSTEIPADAGAARKAVEAETSLPLGFTDDEQATFVENGLRTMGLTNNLGRFVLVCGHGGGSDNNPYFAALDCGACGGSPGDPNARLFAAMGNKPAIRRILSERGFPIPEDTWFLPGKHDTNTDRVTLYDLQDVPATHAEDLAALRRDLELAGAQQALERCHRIPRAPRNVTPAKAYAHVEERSYDWANPRPEWGLSGNASFIVGRRSLTKGLPLDGRAFLHSYDPVPDPEGAILEKIMTAPLVVGEWINMEHYFSAVDPWFYGSGSKVIHNVVSGVGVMLGSQSDLQTGLPLQTVNDGAIHQHEPMRMLAIIEAEKEIIGSIIARHDLLQQLFHNEWVNLVALHPTRFEFHRYNPDATWEPLEVPGSEERR